MTQFNLIYILFFLAIVCSCSTARTKNKEIVKKGKGNIVLHIEDVKYKEKGNLLIIVCSLKDINLYKKCFLNAFAKVVISANTSLEEQKIIIKDVEYGIYGIAILHDENVDFKMASADRSELVSDNEFLYFIYKTLFLFGTASWPVEGFGYSNYTGTPFNRLDFDEFSFEHNNNITQVRIKINYNWKKFGWGVWLAILAIFQIAGK